MVYESKVVSEVFSFRQKIYCPLFVMVLSPKIRKCCLEEVTENNLYSESRSI